MFLDSFENAINLFKKRTLLIPMLSNVNHFRRLVTAVTIHVPPGLLKLSLSGQTMAGLIGREGHRSLLSM